MVALKEEMGWFAKKKPEKALKEWQRDDRLQYSILRKIMENLEDIEK